MLLRLVWTNNRSDSREVQATFCSSGNDSQPAPVRCREQKCIDPVKACPSLHGVTSLTILAAQVRTDSLDQTHNLHIWQDLFQSQGTLHGTGRIMDIDSLQILAFC